MTPPETNDVARAHEEAVRALKLSLAARVAFWAFTVALAIQVLHFTEHVVQVHQLLWLAEPDPKGLFGEHFDFVWVHFAFNSALWGAMFVAFAAWLWKPAVWRRTRAGAGTFAFLMLFQAYHVVEHVVQLYQHYWFAMPKPPGILGREIPNIILHFDLNAIVLALMAAVFIMFRPRPTPAASARPTAAAVPA